MTAAFLAAAAGICLAAWGPAAHAEPPGKALFESAGCASCHRVGRVGGDAGPDLTLVGFRRGRAWLELWLADPRAWKNDTLMPNLRLAAPARAALAEYLASLRGQDFAGRPPWDDADAAADPIRRGRVIYDRAGCVACHGPRGKGGHPNNNVPGGRIAALADLAATYTPAELEARIRRGSRPEKEDPGGPAPLAAMPAWGEVLDESQIKAAAAYLLTLKPAARRQADW